MRIQNPIWSALAAPLARDIPLRDLFGRFGDRPALLLESTMTNVVGKGVQTTPPTGKALQG